MESWARYDFGSGGDLSDGSDCVGRYDFEGLETAA